MGSQWPLRGLSSFSFSCCLSLEYHGSHNHWVVCIVCPSSVNKSKDLTHCRLSMKMGGDKDDEGPWKSNSWYQIFSQCSSKLHHLCPILYWDCLPREEWVPLAIWTKCIRNYYISCKYAEKHTQKTSIFCPSLITSSSFIFWNLTLSLRTAHFPR